MHHHIGVVRSPYITKNWYNLTTYKWLPAISKYLSHIVV